jgi:hypothetical protein
VVSSPLPPTTRTRPFSSGVAVRLPRGTDMLAVAVQLPVSVLVALEASTGMTSARTAQVADATDLMRIGDTKS